jgi:ABC-2 type transport system permease protein
MNIARINTLLLHSWYHATHSKETWIDLYWFTTIQFILFSFIAHLTAVRSPEFAQMLIAGFLFWEIVRIGQYGITVSILWEIWSKSFSTLFVTPLTMGEWIMAQVISSAVKTVSVVLPLVAFSAYFFHINPLTLGPVVIIYAVLLFAFAVSAGIFITALILRFNTDIQSLAWGLIYLFQPISGVFYPISVLPAVVRPFAYLSPVTYVMETIRQQQTQGVINWQFLGMSLVVNFLYFIGAWLFMKKMYDWAHNNGAFARLGN